MLLLPIVVLRVHDPPLLEVEVRLRNIVRIKPVVELVEDGAAAVVVVLGLLPRPQRPRDRHDFAAQRAARPLERALDGVGTCVWTLNSRRPTPSTQHNSLVDFHTGWYRQKSRWRTR